MAVTAATTVPDRPGKTSVWTTARSAGKYDLKDVDGNSTQPPSLGVGSLDEVRSVFWQTFRHLFPPHALAAQTPNGSVVISWSVMDEPDAKFPYAAPVMLRLDAGLVEAMWRSDAQLRVRIAQKHEPTLREGLRGYDPFSRFPNARVVNIG